MGLSSISENRYQYSANFRVKQGERRCRLVTVESRRSSQKKSTTRHHCDRGSRRERCSDRSHVQGASAGRCQDSTCKGNRRGCRSELSACFLRDVAAAIEAVPETLGRKGYVVYAPAGTEQVLRELFPEKFELLLKAGEDLGDALFGATRDLLLAGHDCVLLVNGDSPTLPSHFLVQAIEALRSAGDRLVLGPASDGGYYLIGLKH